MSFHFHVISVLSRFVELHHTRVERAAEHSNVVHFVDADFPTQNLSCVIRIYLEWKKDFEQEVEFHENTSVFDENLNEKSLPFIMPNYDKLKCEEEVVLNKSVDGSLFFMFLSKTRINFSFWFFN